MAGGGEFWCSGLFLTACARIRRASRILIEIGKAQLELVQYSAASKPSHNRRSVAVESRWRLRCCVRPRFGTDKQPEPLNREGPQDQGTKYLLMLLSVCVVTYNHAEFIEQAIRSVIEQKTDFEFNIVVGDDASTDATPAILRRMAVESGGRMIVYSNPSNLGGVRNAIQNIAACDGEFVALLEGDDFWCNDRKLQKQVDFLVEHPQAAFCCHRAGVFDAASGEIISYLPPREVPPPSDIDSLVLSTNPIHLGSVVTRRIYLTEACSFLTEFKLPLGPVLDWPLWFLLAKKGRIGYIPEEMSRYRVNAGGFFSSLPDQLKCMLAAQALLRIRSFVPPHLSDAVLQKALDHARWWSTELVHNPDVDAGVMPALLSSGDAELIDFLLDALAESVSASLHCTP
jgi:glycosyltransferase involved in cell wall biosynthesis